MIIPHNHPVVIAADTGAALGIVGSMVGALPNWAAGMAALWYLMQFIQSRPVRTLYRLHRARARTKRLAKRYKSAYRAPEIKTEVH